MPQLLATVLLITISISSFGQLPACVREKCDSILKKELGEDIYSKCIEYMGFEYQKKLNPLIKYTCETQSSHSYLVQYKFSFPEQEKASFTLGFSCYGYNGQMRIQSQYFLRIDQSDLPQGFREKGLKIVDYKKIAKKAHNKDSQIRGGGVLALDQDKIYWVFSGRYPYRNPDGIGDEAMIVHTVTVDPYTGKIIASNNRRE